MTAHTVTAPGVLSRASVFPIDSTAIAARRGHRTTHVRQVFDMSPVMGIETKDYDRYDRMRGGQWILHGFHIVNKPYSCDKGDYGQQNREF